ncbi:sodium-dependent transporter [Rubripirellula amarantea]|uniref:Sodium:neurotransmitter symporter family protein n=1 Tax=Rubripirellula amarantea TaxID=2527999 RepID=A0A5C5WQY7_9BACT|nr:sodium-dependent transporter [Rubripirellula amarantea]MDA8744467.1 sodium-dependent transporter [Rubripirellula amarantea]TWT53304.1 Sodium:neurotransmitter symporter family protein [Rubripirellula amarantea]
MKDSPYQPPSDNPGDNNDSADNDSIANHQDNMDSEHTNSQSETSDNAGSADYIPKEQWGSRIGVILAVAGSAVGLGNFLRFPGQAAQNGGGAFLLPYFISLLVLGIPLCWAEWTMGRFSGVRGFHSAPGVFSIACRNAKARYLSVFALLIPLVIYMYYIVIEAWCLGYAWNYATGNLMLGADPDAYTGFFNDFVGAEQDGYTFGPGIKLLGFIAITFLVNFVLIYRGVSKGIETFCKFAIPLMTICAICVLCRVLTLPRDQVMAGLGFMWNPKPEALLNSQTWLAASSQIFFSLSVGFGVIINYSSYLSKKDDVVLSGLTACSMNEFFEVCLGGMITIPAAFIFLGVSAASFTTFGLGFNALPNVFAQMPAGQLFGFLWFFMLFLAAITSSLSMLQPVIAFLEEGFGLERRASASILGIIALSGTMFVVYFSAGLTALDTFDFWVGTFLIFVLAMVQAVIYGWVFGIKRGAYESSIGAYIKIPTPVHYLLKYIVPVYLGVIFIAFIYQSVFDSVNAETGEVKEGYLKAVLNNEVALMSVIFLTGVTALLLILIHLAGKRWEADGRMAAAIESASFPTKPGN